MVQITRLRQVATSLCRCSQKTGFGPYRLHRKGQHFVGTEPSPLKYHLVGGKFLLLFPVMVLFFQREKNLNFIKLITSKHHDGNSLLPVLCTGILFTSNDQNIKNHFHIYLFR
ncbi:unnamed protein product [Anisakis simplex]|uniref:Uncharacterized protein n=1 Tax=Anisakis simplex TaxID=6269 RepID=A0A0M3JI35_ANISI|nr:unnamed protein product [Anisakis simplex]